MKPLIDFSSSETAILETTTRKRFHLRIRIAVLRSRPHGELAMKWWY